MKIKLVEKNLTKQEVDDYTKRWFDIKDAPIGTGKYQKPDDKPGEPTGEKMTEVEKRKAYDELYDEVTDIVFDNVKTVKGYNDIKNYMRKAWLKMGFEAGDGNNKAMNLTLDLIKRSSTAGNADAVAKIASYTLDNYDYIDDFLDSGDEPSKLLKFFITQRKDLWSKYPAKDITQIIKSLYSLLKKAKGKELNKIIDTYLKNDNLRDLLTMSSGTDTESTIKVNKITPKSNEQQIIDNLKKSGFDFGDMNQVNKLDKIVQQAKKI